jgi:ferredoxin
MPKVTIQGHGTFEIDEGTRLVNAIEDSGVDVSHRCGGFAGCTTCRVEFASGEPARITQAERDKLNSAGLAGRARLSCQCEVEGDMELKVLMPVSEQPWEDPGPRPEPTITPEPKWISIPEG